MPKAFTRVKCRQKPSTIGTEGPDKLQCGAFVMRKNLFQPRMLCSEIVHLHVKPRCGRAQQIDATVEEIWSSGALLQAEVQVPPSSELWFVGSGRKFRGKADSDAFVPELGHHIEMRFDSNSRWSRQIYRPKHLFNPSVLLKRSMPELIAEMTAPKNLPPET